MQNRSLPILLLLIFISVELTIPETSAQNLLNPITSTPAPLEEDASFQVVERGASYRVIQHEVISTDPQTGKESLKTGRYTEMADGMHFWNGSQWEESQDLIELAENGVHAVAQYGPAKVIFSPSLDVEGAIDLTSAGGKRFRSSPLGLFYFDASTGKTLALASVKGSRATIFAPNRLVYSDAFDTLSGDILYVYAKNGFEQNVVLLERPTSPEQLGLNTDSTYLQVWTEFFDPPEAEKRLVVLPLAVQKDPLQQRATITDEILDFGDLIFPVGKAFSFQNSNLARTDEPARIDMHPLTGDDAPVGKQWITASGRHFLIESVNYRDIEAQLKQLRVAAAPGSKLENDKSDPLERGQLLNTQNRASARPFVEPAPLFPGRSESKEGKEIMVADGGYSPEGVVLDYTTYTGPATFPAPTFLSGQTYFISGGVAFNSGTAVFQPGCVIKMGQGYLTVYNPPTFPATGTMMPVFTSKDDDLFGEPIAGSTHTPTSTGNTLLWLYYLSGATINNARFRYGSPAIEIDGSSSSATYTVSNCLIDQAAKGVDNRSLGVASLSNVRKCSVTTPTSGTGSFSGSMTDDCEPVYQIANFTGLRQSDTDGTIPPDTQAAVGKDYVMELVNGQASGYSAVAIYSKNTGARISTPYGIWGATSLNQFFQVQIPAGDPYAGTYPTGGAEDPRIIYDVQRDRWIAVSFDGTTGYVLLAVSKGANPVGSGGATWVADNWVKHLIPFGQYTDYPTIGVDANGIYVSAVQTTSPNSKKIAAIPSSIFSATSSTVISSSTYVKTFSGEGGDSFAAVVPDGSTGDDQWMVLPAVGGIWYKKVTWSGSTPTVDANWTVLSDPTPYADIAYLQAAPQLGSSETVSTGGASRLTQPIMRKVGGVRYLWTTRTVAVNSTGGASNPDRNAIEWIRITTGPTVAVNSGIVRDSTATKRFYYYASIAANARGDVLLGFSGSSSTEYIGAYFIGCLNGQSFPSAATRYYDGVDHYSGAGFSPFRWGDLSATTVDPDGFRFWTIQEYAETRYNGSINAWGTRILSTAP